MCVCVCVCVCVVSVHEHKLGFVVVMVSATLRASLSGTFLQTLPDLVTPLKGPSLSPLSCPPMQSVPSERFEYR